MFDRGIVPRVYFENIAVFNNYRAGVTHEMLAQRQHDWEPTLRSRVQVFYESVLGRILSGRIDLAQRILIPADIDGKPCLLPSQVVAEISKYDRNSDNFVPRTIRAVSALLENLEFLRLTERPEYALETLAYPFYRSVTEANAHSPLPYIEFIDERIRPSLGTLGTHWLEFWRVGIGSTDLDSTRKLEESIETRSLVRTTIGDVLDSGGFLGVDSGDFHSIFSWHVKPGIDQMPPFIEGIFPRRQSMFNDI